MSSKRDTKAPDRPVPVLTRKDSVSDLKDFEKSCEVQIEYCKDMFQTAVKVFDKYKDIRNYVEDTISELNELNLKKSAMKVEIVEIKKPLDEAINKHKNHIEDLKQEMNDEVKNINSQIKVVDKSITSAENRKDKQLKLLRKTKHIAEAYLVQVSKHKEKNKKIVEKTTSIIIGHVRDKTGDDAFPAE